MLLARKPNINETAFELRIRAENDNCENLRYPKISKLYPNFGYVDEITILQFYGYQSNITLFLEIQN